ncbi:protein translocase subunit SecF [Candidatus Berkiella aquae]|uniref:Protein-export membrane protein SecF n=1 Tax=Candidatus Berkiella aquae TaxID=295108 RepID=A0A0Q9YL20_9GAMM|nr:protein translocase subunit SecF [Candidatus Berkiella aquae]MCS5711018.1 protein translocase subunit SecF [Candidatus Berkiella aquae]
MEFFHRETNFDFMGIRKWTALLSSIVMVVSLGLLFVKGLNFGLDFTGGTQLELRYENPVNFEDVREQLEKAGLHGAKVTQYGSARDILVKISNRKDVSEQQLGKLVLEALKAHQDKVELRRVEFVGSEVGENLAEQGTLAVVVSLFAMMLYIAVRFEYRFGISAAVALMHDPILILGIFSYFQIDFDLAVLAAILAVIGYSLNDTIVIYDRVRENFRKVRKGTPTEIMNLSINQTLSRTIMTSTLTLIVVVALYFLGGESLRGFSLALIIGIIVGTYSSIFVAGALALTMGLSRADLASSSKKIVDDMP